MRLSIDTLSLLEDITSDESAPASVTLDLRAKNSVARFYYANGGARVRLEWDREHKLTLECNAKVLRALHEDPYLATLVVNVLDEEAERPEAEETPDLAALSQYAAPPTMFL